MSRCVVFLPKMRANVRPRSASYLIWKPQKAENQGQSHGADRCVDAALRCALSGPPRKPGDSYVESTG